MKYLQRALLALSLIAMAVGCAPMMQPALKPLGADTAGSASGKYVPKVENFLVVLDASSSMAEGDPSYFLQARDIVSRINQGIPSGLSYNAGLRSFGHSGAQSANPTDLLYGMSSYTRAGFHEGLGKIKSAGGTSPLAVALEAAGKDLQSAKGKSALIIVSDGLSMDAAATAAKKLKTKLGKNVCLYTIAVGHENNGAGIDLLQKVATAGQCGSGTTAAALADPTKMASFIETVFLAKAVSKPVAKPMPPLDSDGDGVTDDKDKCPATPKGEFVDAEGCTLKLTLNINFDFDKAVIKPEFKADLDRAAAYIQKYRKVPYIQIAGHTDHDGSLDYNQKLSENRANAVRKELIDKYGIDPKRLFTKGFGKLQPVADNRTKEGRYQNRRVEIVCCVLKPE